MRLLLLPVIAAALLAGGCDRQSDAPAQGNLAGATVAVAADANAVSEDEVTGSTAPTAPPEKIDRSHAGEAAPAHQFADLTGKTTTLAAFAGKPTLVNLWATWCAPCVKELPTLDTLTARDGAKLNVVAISQDMKADKVAPFITDKGFKALKAYTDPKMSWTPAVTPTLPTTILYGSDGKEVLRVVGDFEWDGPEAAKLIAEAK